MSFLQTPRDRAGLLILLLGVAVGLALLPFASGLLGAAVLYVVCVKPYRRLARKMNPGLAAAFTLLGALLVIALPLAWLVGMVIAQAPDSLQSVQSSPLFSRLGELRIGTYQVGVEIAKASGTLITWVSGQVFNFVGSTAFAALNLVIAFFGLYYMLHSGAQVWPAVREYIPFSPQNAEALRDRFFGVTEATLLGTALTAVVQGALVGVGFRLVGLPNGLFWGTVTAFTSILPVLGSALVWLPAVLVLLLQNQYGAAVAMLVIGGGLASNIDNLIRPLVYKRVSNIHPMITLVGAFGGVRYFGLSGLLLGPLAIAYLFELLQFYRVEYGAPDTPESLRPADASR